MAQVISRWPLTLEAQIHTWVCPCRVCARQSGSGTGFSLSSLVLSCQYHSIRAPYSYIIWGMNRPTGGHSSQTQSHPIHMNNHHHHLGVNMLTVLNYQLQHNRCSIPYLLYHLDIFLSTLFLKHSEFMFLP
jgi:hypothetical protein